MNTLKPLALLRTLCKRGKTARWLQGSFLAVGLLGLSHIIIAADKTADPNAPLISQPQQSVSVDSSAMGLQGPFSFSSVYSSSQGFVETGKYLTRLTPNDAIMLEGALGPEEYRYAFTWAHALNSTQRFKLTAEHLDQKINYVFDSGSLNHWSGQNAFGAGYQVLIPSQWLKTVDFASYYSKANSANLSPVIFNDNTEENFRHIAGGLAEGVSAGVGVSPWQGALVKTALNYDRLRYNTLYQAVPDTKGFGETVIFDQQLGQHVQLELSQTHRSFDNSYTSGINWLVPHTRFSIGVQLGYTNSDTVVHHDTRAGLNFAYRWGGSNSQPALFTVPTENTQDDLTNWTSTPAVHMNQVFTVVDQKTIELPVAPAAAETKKASDTLGASKRVIVVHPGEVINEPISLQIASPAELEPLGLQVVEISESERALKGTIPLTILSVNTGSDKVITKDFPVTLVTPHAMGFGVGANKSSADESSADKRSSDKSSPEETAAASATPTAPSQLIFRVTSNAADPDPYPFAPKLKNPIPNMTSALENPAVDVSVDWRTYFKNPSSSYPMTLTFAGLPANLTAAQDGTIARIKGTASADNAAHGPYTVTVTASIDPAHNNNPTYTTTVPPFSFTVVTDRPLFVGSNTLPSAHEDQAYRYHLAGQIKGNNLTTGIPNDSLPPGLTYDPASGDIAGTPTTAGQYNQIPLSVQNAAGAMLPVNPEALSMTVSADAPQFHGSSALPDAPIDSPPRTYRYDLHDNFTPKSASITVTGLPNGLTALQGVISGVPAEGTEGDHTLSVTATTYGNPPLVQPMTLKVIKAVPPAYDDKPLTQAVVGRLYNENLLAHFNPPTTTLSVTGLPSTLTYANGHITGTPSSSDAGAHTLTIKATNTGITITVQPTLTVGIPPSYDGKADLGTIAQGRDETYDLKTHFAPSSVTLEVSGLPDGLRYNAEPGTITGKPTSVGQGEFTVKATNAGISITTPPIKYTIVTPPTYTGDNPLVLNLTKDTAMTPYSLKNQFKPSNAELTFVPNYNWLGGVYYNPETGNIEGTPTQVGSKTITIDATANGFKLETPVTMTITVTAMPPKYNGNGLPSGTLWSAYASYDLTQDFTPSGTTVKIDTGKSTLPPGMTAEGSKLTGKPLAAGNYSVHVTATHDGATVEQDIPLVIAPLIAYVQCPATAPISTGMSFTDTHGGSYTLQYISGSRTLVRITSQATKATSGGALECTYENPVSGQSKYTASAPLGSTFSAANCTGSCNVTVTYTQ